MATKQENRRTDVIRCEYCGEDYSVTYKRCPFCDGKASYSSDRAPSKGGKRVATNKRGGGYGGGMEPVQIIGLALSIILIIAAIYIVFTVLSPLFSRGEPSGSEGQSSASVSQSDGSISQAGASGSQPDVSASGDVSIPITPDPSGSSTVITPIVTATGITLNKTDITLQPDEQHRLVATLAPAGCTDTITWSSSNESALTVGQDGTVTNVNKATAQANVTVTAQVGDVKATCIVRCKGGSTGSAGNNTGSTTSGNAGSTTANPVASGTTGTVTGTSTGLLIRSGPGRNYEAQDTAPNGTTVTILEQTGDGWYKINYSGGGGRTKTGYVSKDYIKVN